MEIILRKASDLNAFTPFELRKRKTLKMTSIEIFHVLHGLSYFIHFGFLSQFAQLQILYMYFKKAFDSVLVVNIGYLYGFWLEIGRKTSSKANFALYIFPDFPPTDLSIATYCHTLRPNFRKSNFEKMLEQMKGKVV